MCWQHRSVWRVRSEHAQQSNIINMSLSRRHKTTCVNQRQMQHFTITRMKVKTFEQTGGTAKRSPAAPTDPALANSEAVVDSALQDTDRLPPWPTLLELGFITPHSLVWCHYWLFLSDYNYYWVVIDLDWTCINKSWVTWIDSVILWCQCCLQGWWHYRQSNTSSLWQRLGADLQRKL